MEEVANVVATQEIAMLSMNAALARIKGRVTDAMPNEPIHRRSVEHGLDLVEPFGR